MTGIIPCLYNSFSFTNENMIGAGGSIVCYETKVLRERSMTVVAAVPVPVTVPVPVEQPFVYIPSSESILTDSETDTDSSSSITNDNSEPQTSSAVILNPDVITQYSYK